MDMQEHIIELKESMARMEEKQDSMMRELLQHSAASLETRKRVEEVERELERGLASLKLIKWMLGVLAAIPGILYSLMKLIKGA